MNAPQKIIQVRTGDPIYELDGLTETWRVVRVVHTEEHWVYVLVEMDEQESARKLAQHQAYLQVVDSLAVPNTAGSKPNGNV